ncbi:MAG: YbaK/EbsC family protein [Oscillospiraceae bacterium]|nr:YbaK/EbsC family protein [Oscillospiraceae bacterium]
MAIEKVKDYFARWGMQDKIMEFEVSSATVELAAQALHCEGARIAKTLSFLVGEESVLVVAAGDARVDNHKFKETFGVKAKMIPGDQVEERIGHAVGGVCPFGVNDGVKVFLDESLRRFDTVYPACGSSNSAIQLTVAELEKYAAAQSWVDVCKDWDP